MSFLYSHMIRSFYSSFIKCIMGKYFSVNHPLPYKLPNTDPVCSSAYRKRTKQPDLPTWPPLSPGDWPVLQTLTRRKTGEASESSGSVQTCISMSSSAAHCCVLQANGLNALHGVCSLKLLLLVMLSRCAAVDLVSSDLDVM